MIRHGTKKFDDAPLKPYGFSKRLAHNFYGDECEVFIVYGMPEGIGKSAYAHHVLADLLGYQHCRDRDVLRWMWKDKPTPDTPVWESDWEAAKKFVKYPPDEVVEMCMHLLEDDDKHITFHWDDAGTWLNAMDFHDPFVIAFMKYLSLARSNWGGLVLSTPVEDWVLKKLRTAKGIMHIEVKRMQGTDHRYIWRPRIATCYQMRKFKGNPKTYWPRQWEDQFVAIMPDSFFKWYEPRRKAYTKIAVELMRRALAKRKEKGWYRQVTADEAVLEDVEKHIWSANEKSVELIEVVDQKTPLEHS